MVFRSLFNTFVPRNFLYIIIMEITTYNADGTINETKHIDLQVPEYVKKYDEQNSFLNITAEEVEVVNSRKRTFRKTLLLRRLTAAIKHDYANFRDAYKMEADNLEVDVDVFMQEAESDPQIQSGDRIISSIMRIYGNRSQIRHTEVNISEQTFLEQTCTEEEFLIYINKVEHQMADEKGNITSANWIKVIMYHAFKGAGIVRLKDGNVEEEARFYISLQNLINRYYYSLRNMERAAYWMPAELKHQMYVLSAFVKKADVKSVYRFEESRFFTKLINALYLMNEEQRSSLYKMAGAILKLTPSLRKKGANGVLFEVIQNTEQTKQYAVPHELSFSDYNKQNVFTFIINDDDICALRIPSVNNTVLSRLQKELNSIYAKYAEVRRDKWMGSVEIDAKAFFKKNRHHYEDWTDFFYYEIEKYKYGSPDSDLLKPQRSFYHLVCDNIFPDEPIGFNKYIVAGLIEIIIDHPCDSQEGLYECMFRMNFIKDMGSKDLITIAKDKAMKYIGCLFEKEFNLVKPYYQSNFKGLMSQILSLEGIKEKLVKPAPTKKFMGGFNLSLVYNVLGMLIRKDIMNAGAETLDKTINSYARNNNLIDKISERKSFMYETKEIESERNIIEVIIKKYMNSSIKDM